MPTYSDTFTRADSPTLGTGWITPALPPWNTVSEPDPTVLDFAIVSNAATCDPDINLSPDPELVGFTFADINLPQEGQFIEVVLSGLRIIYSGSHEIDAKVEIYTNGNDSDYGKQGLVIRPDLGAADGSVTIDSITRDASGDFSIGSMTTITVPPGTGGNSADVTVRLESHLNGIQDVYVNGVLSGSAAAYNPLVTGSRVGFSLRWVFDPGFDPGSAHPAILGVSYGTLDEGLGDEGTPIDGSACDDFSDSFARADGPIGSDYELPPESEIQSGADAVAFTIDSGALICASSNGSSYPHQTWGYARLLTTRPGNQAIELTVSNLDQGFSLAGQIELYCHMNRSNAACRAAWFGFYEGNISVDTWDYDASGVSGDELGTVFDGPARTDTMTIRWESDTTGAWRLKVNGSTVDSGTAGGPPVGDFVGFSMNWFDSGEQSSPRIDSVLAECPADEGGGGDGGNPVPARPDKPVFGLAGPCEYEVYLMDRSGTEKIRRFTSWSALEFARVINDASSASITLGPALGGFDCCGDINGVVPWAFETSIYRNGTRVWTGPIVNLRRDPDGIVTITSRDKIAWLMKRRMRETRSLSADASAVFNYIVDHAMAPDNVPGLYGTATPAGVAFTRDFVSGQLEKAYDVLQEVSRSAIDYTMLVDQLVAGNFSIPTTPIASLTERHIIAEPGFEFDGMQQANHWFVGGAGGGNRGFSVIGDFGAADTTFGLLEDTVTEEGISSAAAAASNATTRWALSHNPVLVGTDFTFDPSAPVSFDNLVPGAIVQMLLGDPCISLVGQYRLASVNVHVGVSDGAMTESVTASIQPLGFEVFNQ